MESRIKGIPIQVIFFLLVQTVLMSIPAYLMLKPVVRNQSVLNSKMSIFVEALTNPTPTPTVEPTPVLEATPTVRIRKLFPTAVPAFDGQVDGTVEQ